jgi:hypothetical protein
MLTISKRATKIVACLSSILTAVAAVAGELTLPSEQKAHIYVHVRDNHVIATNQDKTIRYEVAKPVSVHVLKAESLRLISHQSNLRTKQFIILSHELSRPGALGHGYCGGGYEDYLVLIELSGRKIIFLDELLLQSCLKSIDLGEDDPINALTQNKNGSFTFQWLSDDYRRNLSVREKRFHTDFIPPTDQLQDR